ncbi:PspC domain-containing protein [Pseudomonadota bacterium]
MAIKSSKPKKLIRSKSNRLIAGIAGGIAEYFDIEPVIVRIAFLILAFLQGVGILLYIVMWFIIPSKKGKQADVISQNTQEIKETAENFLDNLDSNQSSRPNRIFGIILIGIGVLFLLNNLGILAWAQFVQFWPLLIIVLGLSLLFRNE